MEYSGVLHYGITSIMKMSELWVDTSWIQNYNVILFVIANDFKRIEILNVGDIYRREIFQADE